MPQTQPVGAVRAFIELPKDAPEPLRLWQQKGAQLVVKPGERVPVDIMPDNCAALAVDGAMNVIWPSFEAPQAEAPKKAKKKAAQPAKSKKGAKAAKKP